MKISPEMLSYPERVTVIQKWHANLLCLSRLLDRRSQSISAPPSSHPYSFNSQSAQNPSKSRSPRDHRYQLRLSNKEPDHSVTDYQTVNITITYAKQTQSFSSKIYWLQIGGNPGIYLLQSTTPILFSHKLCSGDRTKAGRNTFLKSQLLFFMQAWISWNIWWLQARKRSQESNRTCSKRDWKTLPWSSPL